MQLRSQETAVIRPIKPPFDHDHVLSLSHLDTDRNLLVTLRYLRIYPSTPHQQSDPFHVITAALSAALLHYYPLAGTLRRRHSDSRLELHCRAGDGLPVIGAVACCPLSAVDTEADSSFAELLVPDPDPEEDPIRPMILQVTRFSCGGFVLGTAAHHAICDGFGATLFFNAVAELARGSGEIGIKPVWDRSALLGPRNPPRIEYPIGELLSLDKDFSPYTSSGKRVVKECLNVEEEWLDRVKGLLYKQSGLKFTTFEALGAIIWSTRIKAEKVPANEKVTFAYSMSIRNIVNPSLPAGYWGNSCVPMFVHLTAEQPIWKIAAAIKTSKQHATGEYVASYVDFQELHYGEGISGGRRVSGFTDWRHLGHSTVDFGWGGPTAVVPLSARLLGSVEPCFFLPGKEGRVKVLLHLEESLVLPFRGEMDKLINLISNGLLSAI
ncbi:spermidine coumaroyl-CoA acyltransferase [Salvia miltiorrhiza]|uniref:spermidine coumaroyl-CoA acyltransferase n=1 Tax=Salvia miltiorrhiza TaxID=226208 RepID=UPI0025AB6DA9|nr:spermidine coumaroyl-CoA acyltransferase [Salvia miltiorrhiza]